jgi:hypothetical protein
MSRPKQKRCKSTLSGNDKFWPACINIENLAQAAPIDSFSFCSKSRIALGRELIWDIGKNARQKFVFKFFPIPIRTSYSINVPLPHLTHKGEGE